MLSSLAAPGALHGQTVSGPIQVLAYHSESNFPDDLIIGVTTKGQSDIVEVKVNYRAAGSPVWAYGYSDFKASRLVTSKFRIPASGTSYMPPGAQIEYYFTIRDARGNAHDTPTRTADYSDTRFQWETAQIGRLSLFYHDVPRSRVDSLSGELDGEIQRLESLLHVDSRQPLKGLIYNSFAEAAPAFPNQSRTITDSEVFHGFAFSTHRVFLGIGMQPRIIVHEVAHLMLAQSLDSGGNHVPSWLNEGFASYVEPGSNPYSGQSLSSQGPSLRAMAAVSGTPSEINYFYLKAESVVSFLIEEYGTDAFQRLLAELRRGRPIDVALLNTYGFDTDGLEANWAASPAGRASGGTQDPAAPIVYFDTWFLGGLILVVMAFVFIRYVIRKLRPSTDDEDGPDYWDD